MSIYSYKVFPVIYAFVLIIKLPSLFSAGVMDYWSGGVMG
jgi:hypothetical protein